MDGVEINDNVDIPSYVSYVVTEKCVANCEFCLTPSNGGPSLTDLNTADAKRVLDIINSENVDMVSLAGREPFLRKDIWELISFVKKNTTLALNLETTAVTLKPDDVDRLLDMGVDWVSFTSDNFDKKLSRSLGKPFISREHLGMLTRKFEDSTKSHLKVSSVISKMTLDHLTQVGEALSEHPPAVWKLREFTPRGKGNNPKIEERHKLQAEEFKSIADRIKGLFPALNIVPSGANDYTGALLMIQPDGRMILPHGRTEVRCGHLLRDQLSLTNLWQNWFTASDRSLHNNNYAKTYLNPIGIERKSKRKAA